MKLPLTYDNYIFDLYGTLVDIHTDESDTAIWEKLFPDCSVTLVCVNIHERTVEVKYIVIICEWKFHAFSFRQSNYIPYHPL